MTAFANHSAARTDRPARPVGKRISSFFLNLYVFLSSLRCLYPFFWLIYSALKTQKEFDMNSVALPKAPTLDNFIHVITISDMPRYMLNSLIVTVLSLLVILTISFVTGYFLSRFKFRGHNLLYGIFLVGILIPVHSLMVPMYVFFSRMKLTDHLLTLVLPYAAFQLPTGIYLVESYVHSIPREMEEAAAIDGSSFSYTLLHIILPMTRPALMTSAIISFFYCWNEFSFALILTTSTNLRTIPLGLTLFKGTYSTNYPVMMAATVIAILPALLLYTLFSKNIINGVVTGAVKG